MKGWEVMTTYKTSNARVFEGKLFGCTLTTTRSVKNELQEKVEGIQITIDFNEIPLDKLLDLAAATLVIRRQNNVWKKQKPEQIKQDIGKTIHWSQMGISGGSKAPSIVATIANIMVQNGVPEAQAIERASKIASDPEKLKTMLETMGMLEV